MGLDQLSIQLDGAASNDPDGYIFSYSWRMNAEEIATSSSPIVILSAGVNELQLEVTDNEGTISKIQLQLQYLKK